MVLGAVLLLSLSAVELDWRAPASCPAPTAATLSDDLVGSVEVDVISDEPHRWAVELHFTAPFRAFRELQVGSCEEARRVVAALIELGLKTATNPPASHLTVETTTTPPPAPTPTPSHGPWLMIGVGAAANVASMPGATPRFTLSAGLRWGVLEADVNARAGIPVTTGGTLTVAWWPVVGGEVLGCWVPTSGRLRFGICASALTEWWRLKGAGIAYPSTGDAAFVALGGGFRVSVGLGAGVELGLSFVARVHALRPVATFDDVWFASSPASVEIGGFIRWSTEPTEFGSAGHSRRE